VGAAAQLEPLGSQPTPGPQSWLAADPSASRYCRGIGAEWRRRPTEAHSIELINQ
jgi:hypothetical protein